MTATVTPKKHPQSILGFFSQYFEQHGFTDGLTEYPYEGFLAGVQGYHVIAERNFLEGYLGVRQALPCAAIRERNANGQWAYWMFQRTDKIGEEKLVGKTACFWGGHVDGIDAVFNKKSVLDLSSTLTAGRDREQGEEYRIYHPDSPFEKDQDIKVPLVPANQFIANSTVVVDRYHVAIIYTVDLPDDCKVEVLERELIGLPEPMTAQEALDAHEAGECDLESWAQIYFRHVRAQELLESGASVAMDEPEPVVTVTGESITAEDQAQGYSWGAKMTIEAAGDLHIGPVGVRADRAEVSASAVAESNYMDATVAKMKEQGPWKFPKTTDFIKPTVIGFGPIGELIGAPLLHTDLDAVGGVRELPVDEYTKPGAVRGPAMEWDHGFFHDAYIAANGKNWEEFKQKFALMFSAEDFMTMTEHAQHVSAESVFPTQAKYYPFFFKSKDKVHTVAEMLTLVDETDMKTFKEKVLVHVDLHPITMKPVGQAYWLIKGEKVPHELQLAPEPD